jgi:hypothetical protein
MINLQLDPYDPHVLRITASYLLALAGDITTEITGADKPIKVDKVNPTNAGPKMSGAPIFNAEEIAEGADMRNAFTLEEIAESERLNDIKAENEIFPANDADPAAVFSAGKSVPDIAAVEAFKTVHANTMDNTSSASNVPSPPVANSAKSAKAVALPTASHAPTVELDTRGLPWDARIHSRERTKIANGNWKNKRGLDATTIEAIEGELRGVMSAPAATVISPPVTNTTQPDPAGSVMTASSSNFPDLMKKITAAITGGKVTAAQCSEIVARNGVKSLPLLATRPDLIPQIELELDALIGGAE